MEARLTSKATAKVEKNKSDAVRLTKNDKRIMKRAQLLRVTERKTKRESTHESTNESDGK